MEYQMESEGLEKVCKWHVGTKEPSPHIHQALKPSPLIHDNVLSFIGHTPMVRLNNIAKAEGIKCELLAKCEFFNAGGSVKDRIGKRMIEDAEKQGRIKKGDILIEPTSGNTGIGLALTAAVKGYKMIITLPEKMSQEKVDVLKALGADIIRTPTEAAFDSPDSHIGVALKLNKELANSHILDQYKNPANPIVHYDETAEEIIQQCEGRIDYVVMTVGTGGTITGIARKFKEKLPNCVVVGVDPQGSILALPESLNERGVGTYKVEGIGYDFIPRVLDRPVVDKWLKSEDKESFLMSRRLIREEGLLCGGSSGSALWAALQVAKDLPADKRVVVLLADSIRNYMTKFLNLDWMLENEFITPEEANNNPLASPIANPCWGEGHTIKDMHIKDAVTLTEENTCDDATQIMEKQGFHQLPVVNKEKNVIGVVTTASLIKVLSSTRVKPTDPAVKAITKEFRKVTSSTTIKDLTAAFIRHKYVIVKDGDKVGIVTHMDLIKFMNHAK